ncbi:MAG: response regulator transcription factor [Oscillospiraceae bacterium]|nr:response regulator transcription factor [Oscillospiraceae bacterium]
MDILLCEDDEALRETLRDLLESSGYTVTAAGSLGEARRVRTEPGLFSLCLLDINLPDGTGLELCREIRRQEKTPIIFLTAYDDEDSVVAGLGAGADDYIAKPFRARELLARLEAQLRRQGPVSEKLYSGDICFVPGEGRLFRAGEEIPLRKSEAGLLKIFTESGGRLLRREHLLYALYDIEENFVDENTLSVLVSRLRKKLGRYRGADYIETVRGVGYRWILPMGPAAGR